MSRFATDKSDDRLKTHRLAQELCDALDVDPKTWLGTPNAQLGGQSPEALINAGRTREVRDLILAIEGGLGS